MPTARRRYAVTETDEVARALDAAAKRWPGESRSRTLLRLIDAGARAIEESGDEVQARRRAEVRRGAGLLPAGVYPPDAARALKEEWPA